jgi:biopolymer transport protein TolR
MSMDVGGSKDGIKSDINVTPLVDVMLVLLIIIMIIAPMLQKGVELNMPYATNTQDKPDTADQTVVAVDAMGKLYVNAKQYPEDQVVARLKAVLETKTEKTVYLKGDKDAKYGAIMQMMDALRHAQIDTVGLITERPGGNAGGGGGGQ